MAYGSATFRAGRCASRAARVCEASWAPGPAWPSRGWFSGPIRLLADGAYANGSLVGPARKLAIEVVSRLRADARLREPKPRKQPKGKRGRKPRHGPWMPRLPRLARQRSKFQTLAVAIHGKTVTLRLREGVAWWPPLACEVKVVITRDPKRPKRVAYLRRR